MSRYLMTLLTGSLKRHQTERQNIRYIPPIPFAPPFPPEDVFEHEIKVKINKKISETTSIFHIGSPQAYVIYVDDFVAFICKKELKMRYKGWESEWPSAKLDLELLLLDKRKIDEDTQEYPLPDE